MQLDTVGLLSKEASTFKDIVSDIVHHEDAKPDFSACPWNPMVDRTSPASLVIDKLCKRFGYITPDEEYIKYNL
jgi:hypothetical protein